MISNNDEWQSSQYINRERERGEERERRGERERERERIKEKNEMNKERERVGGMKDWSKITASNIIIGMSQINIKYDNN